jgi:hypothetical protein
MEVVLLNLGRQFIIHRREDVSGVSGTGFIAEGVQFHDGQVAVSWFGKHHILEVVKDLDTWLEVHGHNGRTTIKWLDQTSTFRI